jgi:hypothetical protein
VNRNRDPEYLRQDLVASIVTVLLVLAFVCGLLIWSNSSAAPPERIFADGFETPGAAGPPVVDPPTDPCDHPLVAPGGWVRKTVAWEHVFSAPNRIAVATYPNSVGSPVPVPGFEVWAARQQSAKYFLKGQIVAIPITPLPDTAVEMTWDGAQANQLYGYGFPRPALSMFVGVSACPHDVRIDPLCSRASGQDTLVYSTRRGDGSACRVEAGATYYINIIMANPRDGLTPGEHTCSAATNSVFGCDVQMRHTGS